MHNEYLSKICDEENSSLKGLKYNGGPGMDVTCSKCNSQFLPYVSYPPESKAVAIPDTINCERCNLSLKIEDALKVNEISYGAAHATCHINS